MTREGYNKYKELIETFANGAEIQFYSKMYKGWIDTENPTWDLNIEYRIKPTRIEFEDCSFNDVEYQVTEWSEVIESTTVKEYSVENRKGFIKDKKVAEAYAVLPQLIRLVDEYNGGWKPDWEDKDIKYYIASYKNNLDSYEITHTQRILVFKTKEIRDKFLKDHRDLIEIAKPLL